MANNLQGLKFSAKVVLKGVKEYLCQPLSFLYLTDGN
jgi:hypothetical protein